MLFEISRRNLVLHMVNDGGCYTLSPPTCSCGETVPLDSSLGLSPWSNLTSEGIVTDGIKRLHP